MLKITEYLKGEFTKYIFLEIWLPSIVNIWKDFVLYLLHIILDFEL